MNLKYSAAYLARAFGGELVPQDTKDEPASVLLESIRAEREKQAELNRKGKIGDVDEILIFFVVGRDGDSETFHAGFLSVGIDSSNVT